MFRPITNLIDVFVFPLTVFWGIPKNSCAQKYDFRLKSNRK